MKILLAGTPNFSVSTFRKIIENFEVVGLISQPSKPSGRNLKITEPPTVLLAKSHKIKIFQPSTISEIYGELSKLDFDILLTMAYGQIIPQPILDLAKIGSYNVHASLLPKYRGAAPIQYALLNGDEKTGITLMEMDAKMDAGRIIFQESIDIDEEDNYDSLLEKLSDLSADHIVDWLKKIKSRRYTATIQNNSLVTYSPKISKDDEKILFTTVEQTMRKIRALSSTPGAYLILSTDQDLFKNFNNKRLKIFNATTVWRYNAVEIKCSDGNIYAIDYQFEGRKRVKI